MQSISVRSTRAAGPRVSPSPHGRTPVRAMVPPARFALGDVFRPIINLFSKPETTVDDWQNTGVTGFQGKIQHHEGGGRPFKDGFVGASGAAAAAAKPAAAASAAAAPQPPPQQQGQQGDKAGSYLAEAVERVVGHNFTGDETEPPAGAGSAGWKGDIHDRKSDGFHTRH